MSITNKLSPALEALKQQFIVSAESIVDHVKPISRKVVSDHFYCPYAPCCRDCVGVFTFREVLHHLQKTHKHSASQIKRLVKKGIPRVPERGINHKGSSINGN